MSFQNQDQPPEHHVSVGRIAAAHGVKGLVKILPSCEDIGLIDHVTSHKITLKNPLGKYILAEIEGISSREAAEKISGTELYIHKDFLPEPDDGEFYYDDLIGMECINPAGKTAGRVIAVHDYGAGDLLEIQPPSGETYLLPFNDTHAPDVDLKAKTIKIVPLEGA